MEMNVAPLYEGEESQSNKLHMNGDEYTHNPAIQRFQKKDAIMETDVLEVMKKFISSGGKPQTVVQLLSNSYVGYAQMANLIGDWLSHDIMTEHDVDSIVKEALTDLILRDFDPEKADTIFSVTRSTPKWLDEMIQEQEWRSLVYRLSEMHPSCLMLSFAIQRISEAGHQTEIASLTTASTNFGVFNRVLKHSLERLSSMDEYELNANIEDFQKLCCHSQHTYLYAQYLIEALVMRGGPNAANLRRLSQELEVRALHQYGEGARKIRFLLSGVAGNAMVADALSSMLSAQCTNPADIIKLHTAYSSSSPPPSMFLRDPAFIELLVKDLFTPHKRINHTHKMKYLYILAYATSVSTSPTGEDGTEGKSPKQQLRASLLALKAVHPICQNNYLGAELRAALPSIRSNLIYPVVAMGVIYWVRFNFTRSEFCYNSICTPVHLQLLKEIMVVHRSLLPCVFDTLVAGFDHDQDLEATNAVEMRRDQLSTMIHAMCCGHVLPVMTFIIHRTLTIDQSLIRHFLVELFDAVGPPYSKEFVLPVLDVFKSLDLDTFQIDMSEGSSPKQLVSFIEHCLVHKEQYGCDSSTLEYLTAFLRKVANKVTIKLSI